MRPLVVLVVAAAVTLAGCGSSSSTPKASGTQTQTQAVKAVVTSLFAALAHANANAACGDYTARVQALVVRAGRQLTHPTPTTCAAALAAITRRAPSAFASLGAPQFHSVRINGDSATVAITSTAPGGQLAHSTFTVEHQGDGWKVDRAASLTFSPAG
jgi:hypothetical protein